MKLCLNHILFIYTHPFKINSFKTLLLIIVHKYDRCRWILGRNVEVRIQLCGVCSFHSRLYAFRGLNSGHLSCMAKHYTCWTILLTLKSIDIWFMFMSLTISFIVLGFEPKSLNMWFKQSTTEPQTLPEKVFNVTFQGICILWYQFSTIVIIFMLLCRKNNFQSTQVFLNLKCLAKYWQKNDHFTIKTQRNWG